jgi:hypothetical protein
MVNHIHGRTNLLNETYRPHLFINELNKYVDYLFNLVKTQTSPAAEKRQKYIQSFRDNLLNGIAYYEQLVNIIYKNSEDKATMMQQLQQSKNQLLFI